MQFDGPAPREPNSETPNIRHARSAVAGCSWTVGETKKARLARGLDIGIRMPHANNAPTWTRTKNLLIKSQLLCQLSYGGQIYLLYE